MLNLIDSGFIKLQRKILDWEWYNDIPTKTLFIHLLLKCNFKDKKWRGYDIEKGQILTGRKILSDETGLSEQQIKTALKKLQATNEITIKSTNKFSIITLVKYSFYQDKKIDSNQLNNQAEEQQSTNNQPTINQQATTTKNEKNVKNENKLIVQNENHFEQFWNHYTPIEQDGRAVGKGSRKEAQAEYQKQIKKYNHDAIMQGLKNYLTFCKEKGQLTLQAVRFLKKQTFVDEFNIVIKPPTPLTEAEKSRAILDQFKNSI